MRSEPFAHAPSILPGETSGRAQRHGKPRVVDARPRERDAAGRRRRRRTKPTRPVSPVEPRASRARTSGSSRRRNRRAASRWSPATRTSRSASPPTFYEVGHRRRRRRGDRAHALRRHLPRRPGGRPRHQRPRLVGLDGQPDGRHGRLPGAARRRRRRPGRDDVQGQPGADADHPGDLPRQPARQRDPRRPRRGAAGGRRPCGDGRRPAPQQRAADQRDRDHRIVRAVHGLQRDPRDRLLPLARRAPTTSPRRSTRSATSTSARRTGCTPTTAATSATRRAPRSRCARTSRPARSTGCRRTSSANGTGGNEWIPTRARAGGPGDPVRDPARRGDGRAGQPGARLDLERQPGSDRPDVRQRPAERAAARAAASATSRPVTPTGTATRGSPRGSRSALGRRQRLVRRDAVDPGRREAARRSVLVPSIAAALQAAQTPGAPAALAALGADPKVQEAVARLAAWDFSTPTGIAEGYDAVDVDGVRAPPSAAEIDASVAATIYSLWRGQASRCDRRRPARPRVGLGALLRRAATRR